MPEKLITIEKDDEGERLDKVVAKNTNLSRSKAKKLIDSGKITVNQRTQKASFLLNSNDEVSIRWHDKSQKTERLIPQSIPLEIIYEDDDLLAINKPPNMITHPTAHTKENTLVNALLHHDPTIRKVGEADRPGIVHRLDKDTSGVIIVAKSQATYNKLKNIFKKHTIKKIYTAICFGWPDEESGKITSFISREKGLRFDDKSIEGKKALTDYKVIRLYKDIHKEQISEMQFNIKTGRTHQIRIHAKGLKTPILGDNKYGNKNSIRESRRLGAKRQLLHARELRLTHPGSGEDLVFIAKYPNDYLGIKSNLQITSLDL